MTFLECMRGARPRTIITDEDLAIRAAIKDLMPDTVHGLYTLHLHQNVIANFKDHACLAKLKKLMFRRLMSMSSSINGVP